MKDDGGGGQFESDMDDAEDEETESDGEQVLTIKQGADGKSIQKNTRKNDPMNVE